MYFFEFFLKLFLFDLCRKSLVDELLSFRFEFIVRIGSGKCRRINIGSDLHVSDISVQCFKKFAVFPVRLKTGHEFSHFPEKRLVFVISILYGLFYKSSDRLKLTVIDLIGDPDSA